jgi:hypothetical protein
MTTVSDEWVLWRFRNRHENLGTFGEMLWSRIILGCGLFYVKLADLPCEGGRGPRLKGNDTILPDFDVCGQARAYMDSKCKTGPVLYRKANEWRHGIDRKDARAYETISGLNRQKCFLGIVEIFTDEKAAYDWSGSLLMQSLGGLGAPLQGFSTQSHMVLWPRNRFEQVGVLAPREMWGIARGTGAISDSLRINVLAMFARKDSPPTQGRMF